jgi:CDGSH-type Zn-finger protein
MSVTIRVRHNGPYFLSPEDAAQVRIEDADGRIIEPPPGRGIVLCRCGMSAQKPFCDKSHRNGFDGTCVVPTGGHVPPSAG